MCLQVTVISVMKLVDEKGSVVTADCYTRREQLSGPWASRISGSLQIWNSQSEKAGHGGSGLSPRQLGGRGKMNRILRASLATQKIWGKPGVYEILS